MRLYRVDVYHRPEGKQRKTRVLEFAVCADDPISAWQLVRNTDHAQVVGAAAVIVEEEEDGVVSVRTRFMDSQRAARAAVSESNLLRSR